MVNAIYLMAFILKSSYIIRVTIINHSRTKQKHKNTQLNKQKLKMLSVAYIQPKMDCFYTSRVLKSEQNQLTTENESKQHTTYLYVFVSLEQPSFYNIRHTDDPIC